MIQCVFCKQMLKTFRRYVDGKEEAVHFFTYTILEIGGTQMYVAGKAKYLQERGWQVFIFFDGSPEAKAIIPFLTQYVNTGGGLSRRVMPIL